MPLMHLHYTRGAFSDERVPVLTRALMDVVMRNHIAAKIREQLVPVFRVRLHEIEPRHHLVGGLPVERPVYDVDIVVPAGSLDGERRDAVVRGITEAILAEEGTAWSEADAERVWIIIRDVPDGRWAVGGVVVTARSIFETLMRRHVRAKRARAQGSAPGPAKAPEMEDA